jgi:predicted dinucleotide-binding enzyme
MKIGIIGAGDIGGTLARRFHAIGHEVAVANSRGPDSLKDFARETGARAVSVEEVARGRDVVVITIQFGRVKDLPKGLFTNPPAGLVIIDTNNYYPRHRDGAVAEVEAGMLESRWVEKQVGHPVVKVFNTIASDSLLKKGRAAEEAGRVALPVAGDDPAAKQVVLRLVEAIGFDAVDAGSLDESWRQQPGSPLYGKDFDAAGVRIALREASRERTPEYTATPNSPGTYESPA